MTNGYEKLLVDLAMARVDFIVVGGLAVAFAGYVRATEDVDIIVQADDANVQRLLSALEDFGEGHARELSASDFTMEEGAVRVVEDFPLDIFTKMSGHVYEDLLSSTGDHQVGETTIRYLNAEGLIELKENSLRPRDRQDVQALRQITGDGIA